MDALDLLYKIAFNKVSLILTITATLVLVAELGRRYRERRAV
jgi:hypothetical protein